MLDHASRELGQLLMQASPEIGQLFVHTGLELGKLFVSLPPYHRHLLELTLDIGDA